MFRNELFGKLAKVNKDDRILLLTHDDADGAGAEIVLRCMFPDKNIKVVHLSNGVMSGRVKEALTDAAIAESFGKVIACDISCNEADAEYIDSLPDINSRFVLLDHHLTSQYINRYSWGVSFGDMLEDSFLVNYYSNGHSSGTSLILDYMYYCGINFLPDASRVAAENICLWISAYDTWDWKICFDGNERFKDENLLFAAYGNNLYVHRRLTKIGFFSSYYDPDPIMLKAEKAKRKEHVENIKNQIKFGTLDIPMEDDYTRTYDIAYIDDSKYVFDVLDYMRDTYPERDLFIVNYGNGVSIRSDKEDINVAEIVKPFGGGGHKGAGGFKFEKRDIYNLFEKTTGSNLTLI